MGDVVNLNQYRKRHARDAARRRADVNRVRSGRTAGERDRALRERERKEKELEEKRLDPAPSTSSTEPPARS